MPFDTLRRLVPAPLRRRVKRALGLPERRLHADWKLLERIGPVAGPHVVLDVGAHHGWFFHCWQDWCPGAEVHAFEPTPDSFARCRQLYGDDPRVRLTQSAVGSEAGRARLNVLGESSVSNSLLEPEAATWRAIEYRTGEIGEIEVPVLRLDDYADAAGLGEIHLLKIDVQGFEMEVLRGAEATLPRVAHVFVESGIRPLYRGGARFSEVFDHLTGHGFHLIGMRAWHRGNHALVEADLLFRRDDLMPPIDARVDRIYESS